MDIRIRFAEARDVARLAAVLRAGDRAEIAAASGLDPREALAHALRLSSHAWFAETAEGTPLALWGVGEIAGAAHNLAERADSAVGCPWLLASAAFDELPPRRVARLSRRLLGDLLAHYPRLENHVDARHRTAVRWLAWLGFVLEPASPWGFEGRPFHRFWMATQAAATGARKKEGPAEPAPRDVPIVGLERGTTRDERGKTGMD
jgi:hypothetical protein